MYFGEKPPSQCKGAILAHALRLPDKTLKKGTRLTAADLDLIIESKLDRIWVAIVEEQDLSENDAASKLADSLIIENFKRDQAFTGRANIFSTIAGVFCPNRELIDRFNRIHPSITLATLDDYTPVQPNQMVATIKIIPFAVEKKLVTDAAEVLKAKSPAMAIAPFEPHKIGVLSTTLPHLKDSVIEKTLKILESRLEGTGSSIHKHLKTEHTEESIAKGILSLKKSECQLVIIFGASAISDISDVIPASIQKVGGSIIHFGLPVDPGNLLLMARIGDLRVIGAPGCARSPKENGFDWILERTLAGLDVDSDMLAGLGVGGLLKEIVSRPSPRSGVLENMETPRIAAIILAAGRSSRMNGPNKLLAEINGKPLARIAAEAALGSKLKSVIVVTGHMADEMKSALNGLDLKLFHNSHYEEGLSTSLRKGIESLPKSIDGALIMLADMPIVNSSQINSLIDAFNPATGSHIIVSTDQGKKGNPVIWSRRYFEELCRIKGDVGAKFVMEANPESVVEVELGEAARLDIDTATDLKSVGGVIRPKNES